MNRLAVLVSPLIVVLFSHCASTRPEGATAVEQRQYIDADAATILEDLEKNAPESRKEIEESEGYAVFRYSSGKLPLILGGLGAGGGYGVAVDGGSDERTYMRVRKLNWGWGMGVKGNSVVFIYDDRDVFEKFRSGKWDGGAAAEATAKKDELGGGVGGTATAKQGFKAYEMTDAGLSYGITYQTRRFSPIRSLNR